MKYEMNDNMLVEVAQLYYMENKTQEEIAQQFGISRPMVSKLLKKAKECDIVKITIQLPSERMKSYENNIASYFHLHSCYIIPDSTTTFETEEAIVQNAFNILDDIIAESSIVGIGWGSLINALCEHQPISGEKDRSIIVPLIGSLNATKDGYNTNELVRKFGIVFGMEPYYLYAPAFPPSEEELEQFQDTINYKKLSLHWDKLDIALFRINNYPCVPDPATSMRFGAALAQEKAVGTILSSFYDIAGKRITGQNDWSICISPEQFLNTPVRFAISASTTTPQSLLGALRTGMITHLIATETHAKEIIQLGGL